MASIDIVKISELQPKEILDQDDTFLITSEDQSYNMSFNMISSFMYDRL